MIRNRVAVYAMMTLLAIGCSSVLADSPRAGRSDKSGRVDWDKGVVYATGSAPLSIAKYKDGAKAYRAAQEVAYTDALRKLVATIRDIKVDSRTVVKDFELVSDTIKTELSGLVRGAQIVKEEKQSVGGGTLIKVTIATSMYGDEGIVNLIKPEFEKRAADVSEKAAVVSPLKVEVIRPVARPTMPQKAIKPNSPQTGYTSLIIDCRGLGLERAMSPCIRRDDGSELFGGGAATRDFLIDRGIVSYQTQFGEAVSSQRAGSNPLMIRAIGRAGGKFNCDAVVSAADARTILEANSRDGFLSNFNVIFVLDSGK